jgi:hypothetical protein
VDAPRPDAAQRIGGRLSLHPMRPHRAVRNRLRQIRRITQR